MLNNYLSDIVLEGNNGTVILLQANHHTMLLCIPNQSIPLKHPPKLLLYNIVLLLIGLKLFLASYGAVRSEDTGR